MLLYVIEGIILYFTSLNAIGFKLAEKEIIDSFVWNEKFILIVTIIITIVTILIVVDMLYLIGYFY